MPSGKKFFLLLVDDMSRYMWLTLLTSKDEVAVAIKRFKGVAELEADAKLRTLRTDRGGEFTSHDLAVFCANQGMKRHTTTPYSPQQNGVVERRNQTVLAMARSMMKAKGLPSRFWGEVVSTAVYLLNRAPTRAVDGRTPYEAWHGKKPEVSHLRVFGCVKPTKSHAGKLENRSTAMVFLGYEQGMKGYRVYDPVANRLQISRDVVFDENASWDWSASDTPPSEESFSVDYSVRMVSGSQHPGGASPMTPTQSKPMAHSGDTLVRTSPAHSAGTPVSACGASEEAFTPSSVVQGGPQPWRDGSPEAA
jgi:hypothetical protein